MPGVFSNRPTSTCAPTCFNCSIFFVPTNKPTRPAPGRPCIPTSNMTTPACGCQWFLNRLLETFLLVQDMPEKSPGKPHPAGCRLPEPGPEHERTMRAFERELRGAALPQRKLLRPAAALPVRATRNGLAEKSRRNGAAARTCPKHRRALPHGPLAPHLPRPVAKKRIPFRPRGSTAPERDRPG